MNLDLDLLHTFLSVIEEGGFTRAATKLNKTQSTVSLHIRRLEDLADRRLFERRGRTIALTVHGEMLRSYAETLVGLNKEALARLRKLDVEGCVRLGLLEDFATHHLPVVLHRFSKTYSSIRIDVRSALTAELMRDLQHGRLDLVVARRVHGDEGGRLLRREPLVWVGAKGRRFGPGSIPLVMFPRGCVYRPEVLQRLRTTKRPWQIVYTSSSLAGVQAAVLAGLGVTVLAESTLLPEFSVLGAADGLPALPNTEIAIYGPETRSEAIDVLADYLFDAIVSFAPQARPDMRELGRLHNGSAPTSAQDQCSPPARGSAPSQN